MQFLLSRALISIAAAVAAIILVATAAVSLGAALYLFLISQSAAPSLAALLVGLVELTTAGLIIFVSGMTWRYGRMVRSSGDCRAAVPGAAGNVNNLAATLGSLAAQELTSQARAHPYRALAVSLLAGLAVGTSPELRSILEKMLKN